MKMLAVAVQALVQALHMEKTKAGVKFTLMEIRCEWLQMVQEHNCRRAQSKGQARRPKLGVVPKEPTGLEAKGRQRSMGMPGATRIQCIQ